MTEPVPGRRRKLPPKYVHVVLPFVLSGIMTFIISGISTVNGVGLAPDLLQTWARAWVLSWMVSFPTLLMVLPAVRRIVGLVVEMPAGR